MFVVHSIPEETREQFEDYKAAFKAFKKAVRRKGLGSVAMWRGPDWTKLYEDGLYPHSLTQPHCVSHTTEVKRG
jgi:hypothetical protein